MSEIPKTFVREYSFTIKGETIKITRYDNYHHLIPDGCWVACWVRGGMNPWYLNADGTWKYKSGCTFLTAEDTYAHCLQYPPTNEAWDAQTAHVDAVAEARADGASKRNET